MHLHHYIPEFYPYKYYKVVSSFFKNGMILFRSWEGNLLLLGLLKKKKKQNSKPAE